MPENLEIEIDKNYNIKKLKYWLNYSLSSFSLYLLSWFWGVTIFLVIGAAIIFTPYMLKILYEERRIGWIIFFIIIVVMPLVIIYISFKGSIYLRVLELIPLATYYFYCFLLRITISDWLDETVIVK